tara:strand:- start:458 stop:739 length:282 start_codon:yes stop_codon:yes gene_type:complete
MKKSDLKELIKSIIKEQGPRPANQSPMGQMNIPGGGRPKSNPRPANRRGSRPIQPKKQIGGGGNYTCVCANGTTCPGKFMPASGAYDCSCCTR